MIKKLVFLQYNYKGTYKFLSSNSFCQQNYKFVNNWYNNYFKEAISTDNYLVKEKQYFEILNGLKSIA